MNSNLNHKIEKYIYKLKNAHSRADARVYQQKLKYYKKLNMHGGDLDETIKEQSDQFKKIIDDQTKNREEAKQHIEKLREDIKKAYSNHETLKKKAESACKHLDAVNAFLVEIKKGNCDFEELKKLTLDDLLDETKFIKICSGDKITPPKPPTPLISTKPILQPSQSLYTVSSQQPIQIVQQQPLQQQQEVLYTSQQAQPTQTITQRPSTFYTTQQPILQQITQPSQQQITQNIPQQQYQYDVPIQQQQTSQFQSSILPAMLPIIPMFNAAPPMQSRLQQVTQKSYIPAPPPPPPRPLSPATTRISTMPLRPVSQSPSRTFVTTTRVSSIPPPPPAPPRPLSPATTRISTMPLRPVASPPPQSLVTTLSRIPQAPPPPRRPLSPATTRISTMPLRPVAQPMARSTVTTRVSSIPPPPPPPPRPLSPATTRLMNPSRSTFTTTRLVTPSKLYASPSLATPSRLYGSPSLSASRISRTPRRWAG